MWLPKVVANFRLNFFGGNNENRPYTIENRLLLRYMFYFQRLLAIENVRASCSVQATHSHPPFFHDISHCRRVYCYYDTYKRYLLRSSTNKLDFSIMIFISEKLSPKWYFTNSYFLFLIYFPTFILYHLKQAPFLGDDV